MPIEPQGGTRPLSPATLILGGIASVLFVAALVTPADADLWGHLVFGRDIIRTGHVVLADVYSFSSDRAWTNHEWLAEVIFFAVYRNAGTGGLIGLKLAIITALMLVLWRYLRMLGVRGTPAALTLGLAFVSTYWRTHNVRPQLFSVLLFGILLTIFMRTAHGRWRSLLLVPPVMALWANLHGGWIVGSAAIIAWAGGESISRDATPTTRWRVVAVAIAALAATLLNPYGTGLWTFLAETVRLERSDTEDWSPLLSSPIALGVPWLLALAAAVWAIRRRGWPGAFERLAIVGGLAFASLRVSRLDAFFGLGVVILLVAPALAPRQAASIPVRRRQRLPVLAIVAAMILAIALPVGKLAASHASCITISGSWAPDPDAARFIAANQLQGRMLTWYDWGQYAIWHFGPRVQVSIDGRRETVYSDATTQAHRRFYANKETGTSLVQQLEPDFIWLPASLPVISRLPVEGWTAIFSSPASVIFARASRDQFVQPESTPQMPRCFPGP